MLEGLTPNQLLQGGAAGLLALIIVFLTVAISRGWLIPRSVVKQIYEAQEARVLKAEERETLAQEANGKLTEAVQLLSEGIHDNNEQGRTMIALLQALSTRRPSGR